VSRWHRRKPEAAARLQAVRDGLAELSERVAVPTENLVLPELVRRLCWDWQAGIDIDGFLREGGARPWQRELVVPVVAGALAVDPGVLG
jgi:ribonuclease D